MMILLAFAFSHIMTMIIQYSLLKMSSEGFNRNFSRLKNAINTYAKEVKEHNLQSKFTLEEKLEYWFRQTDLAGLKFESKSLSKTLCRPDIIEEKLTKYENDNLGRINTDKMNQFLLHVEGHFNLPMLSKQFTFKLPFENNEIATVKLYIHYTWVEWKLIEFRVISVIMSLILMIFLLLAAGGPVKEASKKLLEYSIRLKKANSDLEETNNELEKKTQHLIQTSRLASLGEMSATVSHELKNPLAAISSGLQLLELHMKNGITDKSSEVLGRVTAEIERLHRILESMLKFARPSDGNEILFSVSPLIEKVILLVQKHAQKNQVKILPSFKPVKEKVKGDPIQIEQVLLNLILNSIEAIENEGTIEINMSQTDNHIVIEVKDTGCGFGDTPPEELFKAFATKSKEDGTGLGLSISRSIIKRHGGNLTISNSLNGQGATALITLPWIKG